MSLTIIDNNNIFQKDVIGNVRTAQEDSHDIAVLTPNGDVFVVCDGMGGHVGGKQASSIAVKCIIDYLKKEKYPQPVQALNDALQFANMQILGYANEHPEFKGMGTTACIVLLQDSEAYIAHVGDSRIYLYLGKEKQLHRITKDHSFVQTLVDAGQITDEEAEHHPNKNRILKALGIKPDLAPSFDRVQPKNGDVFLICSDGLSGMISDAAMHDVLMKPASLEEKGDTLINLALGAGGLDNITLELIQIANSPHSKSAFRSYNPTDTKPQTQGKWRYAIVIATVAIVIVTLCSLFLCRHITINKLEKRMAQTSATLKLTVDSLNECKHKITEIESKIEQLSEKMQEDISVQNNPSQRDEVRSKYDQILEEKESELERLKEEKENFISGIDDLKTSFSDDSTRRAKLDWGRRKNKE